MAINDLLRWESSQGWIVLSGGADAGGEIRAQALRRTRGVGGAAYIGFNEDSADEVLDDMEDLGAPAGYLVNIIAEDDDTIRDLLRDASIIVIESSVSADEWRSSLLGAAVEGLREALDRGAVILAEGTGAAAFGEYLVSDHGELVKGLGWLQNTLILPDTITLAESPVAQDVLDAEPDTIAIGIGIGSALVLGVEGRVEVWGEHQVTIALGRSYQQ